MIIDTISYSGMKRVTQSSNKICYNNVELYQF